jgi:hypothetical protein
MTNGGGSDMAGHFRAGFEVVKRYPMLIVPVLAVHVAAFVLALLVWGGATGMGAVMGGVMGGGGGAAAGGIMGFLAGGMIFMLLVMLLSLVASGVVVVMARDALAGREPVMGDALGAVLERLIDVSLASFLVTVIVGIGLALLVIPGLLAGFFLIFTLPAVLLDRQSAVDGLKRSFNTVKANPGPVVGLVVGAILVAVGAAIVSGILRHVPVLGGLASAVVGAVLVSYVTVVGVRVYQALPRG